MKTTLLPLVALLPTLGAIASEPPAPQRGGHNAEGRSQPRFQREGTFIGTMPSGDAGPRNHRILLAMSGDGLNWTVASESLAEQASVPELFEGPDGKLIALFVDASSRAQRGALGAMVQGDDGNWSRTETNLRGADPNIVRLKDGSYRGYTKDRDGAIMVFESRDGLQWKQRGIAFQDERYRNSTDSDVFEGPEGWVMLISLGPRMLRCTSDDGLKFITDGTILELGGSVSDTVKADNGWRTYFHVNASPRTGGKMRIRSAFTADGKTWQSEEGDRVVAPASGPARLGVADPAPVRLKNGSWLMALKSFIESPAQSRQPARAAVSSNPANDFDPPVGRDENSPHESPGHFRLLSARSDDGLTFVPTGQIISDQANVPDLIAGPDGAIHLYYTGGQVGNRNNTLALAISRDQGRSWTFKHVEIEGSGLEHAGDPDIVRLDDGTFRIFLTTMVNGCHGVICCDSTDGIHFTPRGTAFAKAGLELPDSTTFRLGSMWHMLTLEGRGVTQRHGTSSDGREFAVGEKMPFVADGEPYIAANGVPVDGGYRMYGFSPPARNFRSFFSSDGRQWTVEKGIRLALDAGSAPGSAQIKDPSVLRLADGSYLMVYVARLP